MRPVEKVDNDNVKLDAQLLVFSCDLKHLIGSAVTELALPETKIILAHNRRPAHAFGVVGHDLSGSIVGGYPVIHHVALIGYPLGDVGSESRLAC